MDRLIVVRHARAAGHEDEDPGLSPLGAQQAADLADRLAESAVSQVLCSPKRRAVQTASAIADRAGVPAMVVDDLDDRTPIPTSERWGDYPEHRWEWLRETPAEEQDPDGAGIADAWMRVCGMLDGTPGALVVVTHAFVVGSFIAHALSAPPAAWMLLLVDNTAVVEMQRRENGELAVVVR